MIQAKTFKDWRGRWDRPYVSSSLQKISIETIVLFETQGCIPLTVYKTLHNVNSMRSKYSRLELVYTYGGWQAQVEICGRWKNET